MIRLFALGPPDLTREVGNSILPVVAQPKRLALLVYLGSVVPAGFRRRDELLSLFWPERDGPSARTALRKSLHFLRKHLGPEALPSRGDEVGVDPDLVWSDVRAFRSALEQGLASEALSLYRGDLLEALHAEGASGFEDWLDEERRRLRAMATEAALQVAEFEAEGGKAGSVTGLVRRAADLSPFDETVHRRALRILDGIGDHGTAIRFHEAFEERMAQELEASPSPETENLVREIRRRRQPSLGRGKPQRLAVLPLANISSDREQDYFAEGMTEELISVLAGVGDLAVIARTSVMGYRGSQKSVGEIAGELDVGFVIEGSVRRSGGRLRMRIRLIDAESQTPVWSEDYQEAFGDVFRIQGEIARSVADALQILLSDGEQTRLRRAPTADLLAYDRYLMGRHQFNTRSEAGFRRAVQHFQAAIALDGRFALAYAALGELYALAALGFAHIPDAPLLAKDAARRALELDETLAEAHGVLGYVTAFHDWDLATADRELARAGELNPSGSQILQWHSHVAQFQRRFHEAARLMRRAHELDPKSVVIQNERGWAPAFLGDFETAQEHFRRALAIDPTYAMAHYNLGGILEQEGDFGPALDHLRRAVELSHRVPLMVGCLGSTLARAGERDEARELLRELEAVTEQGGSVWIWKGSIHDALGEVDEALDCIERAIEDRDPIALLFDTRHFLFRTSLGKHPRFIELRDRLHGLLRIEGDPVSL